MALEVTRSDVLQQLGVSYSQLIDYSSEAFTAILVSPTIPCRSFTYADIGSGLRFSFGHMGLYYYLVCILLPFPLVIINISHSDGEMAFFWQAERRSRWSVARILFMLVRPFAC